MESNKSATVVEVIAKAVEFPGIKVNTNTSQLTILHNCC